MIQNFEIEREKSVLTNEDLLKMKIIFMNSTSETMSSLESLIGKKVSTEDIGELGFTLKKMGPIKNSTWALYNSKLDVDFVKDVLHKRNLYTISLTVGEANLETVKHAYIREDYIDEDVDFYIRYRFNKKEAGLYSITLKEPYEEFVNK